jgi:hypothetical protein
MGHFLAALLGKLCADEVKAWLPAIAEWLTRAAVRQLPAAHRERYNEEWHSYLDEIPGEVAKVFAALGFFRAARPRFHLSEIRGVVVFVVLWPLVRTFILLVRLVTRGVVAVVPTFRYGDLVAPAQLIIDYPISVEQCLNWALRENLRIKHGVRSSSTRFAYWEWRERRSKEFLSYLQHKGLRHLPATLDIARGKLTIKEVLQRL